MPSLLSQGRTALPATREFAADLTSSPGRAQRQRELFMKTLATMAAVAALVGGLTVAQAQTTKQGGAPGDPPEAGQAAERGQMGQTGSSTTNPSPMAPAARGSSTTGTAPKD